MSMAIPSKKTEGMEETLKMLFGVDRRDAINNNLCQPAPIGCGGVANVFRDEISRREYRISGLCQKCQDSVFNND